MYSLAIGVFDGVHLGHQKVLMETVKIAEAKCLKPAIMSFYPSKKGLSFKRLSDRISIFKKYNFYDFFFITPKSSVYNMNGEEFVQYISKLSVKEIFVGKDFTFGKDREYGVDFLKNISSKYNIKTNIIDIFSIKKEKLSTSKLKELIKEQNFDVLNSIYKESFAVSGVIVKGKRFGTTKTGFKTANLKFNRQILPPTGVYITETLLDEKKYFSLSYVGTSPVLKNESKIIVETHILEKDFPPLYGKRINIKFKSFLRKELSNIDKSDLIRQIKIDVSKAINTNNNSINI